MGQQHKKVIKRRRRMAYVERQKAADAARSKQKARPRAVKKAGESDAEPAPAEA